MAIVPSGDMALIYPKTPQFTALPEPFHFSDHLRLHVLPFDLEKEQLELPDALKPFFTRDAAPAKAA